MPPLQADARFHAAASYAILRCLRRQPPRPVFADYAYFRYERHFMPLPPLMPPRIFALIFTPCRSHCHFASIYFASAHAAA